MLGAAACSSGGDEAGPTTRATTTTTIPAGTRLVDAACKGELVVSREIPLKGDAVTEASGIVESKARPGIAWINNDSGDRARIYGVDQAGGVQVVDVRGATAIDWEDVERAPGGGLWIADTGDNTGSRPDVQLYRVPEPAAGATSVAVTQRIDVTYPDGPINSEALLADPANGRLVILSKEPGRSRIYEVVPPRSGDARVEAKRVGTVKVGDGTASLVTAADVAPDRSALALRVYEHAYLYPVAPKEPLAAALEGTPCEAPTAPEGQGEAIGFFPDSAGYETISEAKAPKRAAVVLGVPARPTTTAAPTTAAGSPATNAPPAT